MANQLAGTMGSRPAVLRRMDGVAWGLFFIWVGVAQWAHFSWAIGLLGVGILMLGGQLARRKIGASLEPFWIVVGSFFTLGGVWMLLDVRVSLLPVCSILAGLALLATAIMAKPDGQARSDEGNAAGSAIRGAKQGGGAK